MSVATADPSVNSMSDQRALNVAARLKRDVGIHRVAQTLADAYACRVGAELCPLSQMSSEDRDWYKATARALVDIYETFMGITPIKTVAEPTPEDIQAQQPLSPRTMLERQRARTAAIDRGHDMGTYRPYAADIDWAVCRACGRSVLINLTAEPPISGTAITEGCLTAVGKDGE